MKLPEIYGNNKIRDFKILEFYKDGESQEAIASRFDINQTRVSQIIYRNRNLLNRLVHWTIIGTFLGTKLRYKKYFYTNLIVLNQLINWTI